MRKKLKVPALAGNQNAAKGEKKRETTVRGIRMTEAEFAAQDAQARAAGLSWAAWVRATLNR